MKIIHVVYTLIQHPETGHILMVKNRRGDSFDYSLPGGGVESSETLQQGAIREVEEETGYIIKPTGILAINEKILPEKKEHLLFITFHGSIIGGKETLTRPDEILAIEWVETSIASERMPYLPSVEALLRQQLPAPYLYEGER
ncbi:NUDIX hydrolase [Marininema halotolerans]|uniref:8-oxo-dGTP diphosphatase n=1 Tax=Marininema halotolerans TaxID=1155944 RepID=A0A1I6SK38_9BACL|nr:NUDIX hydrolase [Marininema halotolerans]SFS77138.1 8-oxo-dGTP diphosphatase [Marininema halotolerans]